MEANFISDIFKYPIGKGFTGSARTIWRYLCRGMILHANNDRLAPPHRRQQIYQLAPLLVKLQQSMVMPGHVNACLTW